jgi:hypothetical protein
MSTKKLLVKNVPFDGVRAVISASQSSVLSTYYSEGSGQRYYVNALTSTASSTMESATFDSYLSFTMSDSTTHTYDLIPMLAGNSVIIDSFIYAQNLSGSKGFVESSFGAFRHTGSVLTAVGSGIQNTKTTDFPTGHISATWLTNGTQSVYLNIQNITGEVIDVDVYISYRKGFHSISTGSTASKPIYPQPNNPTS